MKHNIKWLHKFTYAPHPDDLPPEVKAWFSSLEAVKSTIRQQQGLGRPIVSCEFNGSRHLAVADKLYIGQKNGSFRGFLLDYINDCLGRDWINCETAKKLCDQHPIIIYCTATYDYLNNSGKDICEPMPGVVQYYMRLAYNLYLLVHNLELSERNSELRTELIKKLKNKKLTYQVHVTKHMSVLF